MLLYCWNTKFALLKLCYDFAKTEIALRKVASVWWQKSGWQFKATPPSHSMASSLYYRIGIHFQSFNFSWINDSPGKSAEKLDTEWIGFRLVTSAFYTVKFEGAKPGQKLESKVNRYGPGGAAYIAGISHPSCSVSRRIPASSFTNSKTDRFTGHSFDSCCVPCK